MDQTSSNDFYDNIEDLYDIPEEIENIEHTAELHHEAARALACCINTLGSLNLRWMSDTSGLSVNELIEALDGEIYQDPEAYDRHHSDEEDWMLRDRYLSGNIAEKLIIAEEMNIKYDGRFESNILALKEALPPKVPFDEIGISIGSAWVPDSFYTSFAMELLGVDSGIDVFHVAELGQWKVDVSYKVRPALNKINNEYVYGYTYSRNGITITISMLKILEHTLNGNLIKVYEEVERPDRKSGIARILLSNETIAAQEKQAILEKAFKDWIRKNPSRVKKIEKAFYNILTCHLARRYNGDFLTLPGLNPEFTPYPHQRNAVARIVLDKDVLLNHTVGTGKTSILIMGVHERYRMGLSRKNLVVVPNNVLEAFERAHRFLYPDDRFLVIWPKDFRPAFRQKMLEKIRDEDFVAVYMAFSSFNLIRMSREYRLEEKDKEISSLRSLLDATKNSWKKYIFEEKIKGLQKEKKKMDDELPGDVFLPFDELGITTLVVDEAHNYKNIKLKKAADGVAGLRSGGSKKCIELMDKAQYVRCRGGSILFSTGTPLTNSISDLFVLQMYLQPEQMRLLRIGFFDEWIGTFASRKSGFEMDVDSQNFRIMTRFSCFHNLPELISIFSTVCDYYSGSETSGVPECGKYIDIKVPKSSDQFEYMETLVTRTEEIRAKLVDPQKDNLLKVTHDGRAASLDIRLVDPYGNPDPEGTKTFMCAKNVFDCWKKYPGTTQLIFCDIGTPKAGFNIYDLLKEHLIGLGIPKEQIAFAHDAVNDTRRRKLFKAVNEAEIRVLLGSTPLLGTGVNVQENLIAVHHLDVPWKPSEMVQREGRMIRPGNRNKEVFRYRYFTVGMYDSYLWQICENKQRFISQFMSGTIASRDIGDIDETVLSYAEIKALSVGDELIKKRIDKSNELEYAKINKRQRDNELHRFRNIIAGSPVKIEKLLRMKDRLIEDRNHYRENRETIDKQERAAFGEELLYALCCNVEKEKEQRFSTLHGFDVLLPASMKAERPYILITGVTENRYEVEMKDAKELGCIQKIEYRLNHLEERICAAEKDIERTMSDLSQAKEKLKEGNPFTAEVSKLKQELFDIDMELRRRAGEVIT